MVFCAVDVLFLVLRHFTRSKSTPLIISRIVVSKREVNGPTIRGRQLRKLGPYVRIDFDYLLGSDMI